MGCHFKSLFQNYLEPQTIRKTEREGGRERVGRGREIVGATDESSIKAQRPALSASVSAGGPKLH